MAQTGERLTRGTAGSRWAAPLVLLAVLCFPGLSHAHEDYPWVRNPQYRTASGAHCCSEEHCQPASAGEMTPTPAGWRHNPTGTEITADKPGIYQTEDKAGRVFRCVMGGKLVCVFEGAGT